MELVKWLGVDRIGGPGSKLAAGAAMRSTYVVQTVLLVILAFFLPETGSRGAAHPAAAAPTKSANSGLGRVDGDGCHERTHRGSVVVWRGAGYVGEGRLGGCHGGRVPILRALRGGVTGFGEGKPTKWQDNEGALEMYHNALRERPTDANLWLSPPPMALLLVCMSRQSLRSGAPHNTLRHHH